MRDMNSSPSTMSGALLDWYDTHAREMPWRVGPTARAAGTRPDPYRVWLSEIMLQQTTVAAVRAYFMRFTQRWPTVMDLAAADDADVMSEWAGLGYYARARNLLKCARLIAQDHNGSFPQTYDALLKLPGVGPYTAAAVASIAFDQPATVLDGNVERVMARIHDIHAPLPGSKPQLRELAATLTPAERPGDYAQAVMDLGATICTPRNPACGICPWRTPCAARVAGTAADLPKKTPKKPKPTRQGIVYLACSREGTWLLERRPDKGLLGGTLGWPGTIWQEDLPAEAPPFSARWQQHDGEVRHTFTHFHLILRVMSAELPAGFNPNPTHELITSDAFRPTNLPTVMRKAHDLLHSAA